MWLIHLIFPSDKAVPKHRRDIFVAGSSTDTKSEFLRHRHAKDDLPAIIRIFGSIPSNQRLADLSWLAEKARRNNCC